MVRARSLEYSQPILDSGYAIRLHLPATLDLIKESSINQARGRARGQTTPLLARPLQKQPSRLVDGVPAREGESLPQLGATNPASAHQNQETAPVSADSPDADEDRDGLAVGDGLIITDRVTVDGLGAAVTV